MCSPGWPVTQILENTLKTSLGTIPPRLGVVPNHPVPSDRKASRPVWGRRASLAGTPPPHWSQAPTLISLSSRRVRWMISSVDILSTSSPMPSCCSREGRRTYFLLRRAAVPGPHSPPQPVPLPLTQQDEDVRTSAHVPRGTVRSPSRTCTPSHLLPSPPRTSRPLAQAQGRPSGLPALTSASSHTVAIFSCRVTGLSGVGSRFISCMKRPNRGARPSPCGSPARSLSAPSRHQWQTSPTIPDSTDLAPSPVPSESAARTPRTKPGHRAQPAPWLAGCSGLCGSERWAAIGRREWQGGAWCPTGRGETGGSRGVFREM